MQETEPQQAHEQQGWKGSQQAIGSRRVWKFVLLCLLSEVVWLGVGTLFVPAIIIQAYHGKSAVAINGFFVGQPHPVEFYLQQWSAILHLGVLFWLGLWAFALVLTSPAFWQRYVGE